MVNCLHTGPLPIIEGLGTGPAPGVMVGEWVWPALVDETSIQKNSAQVALSLGEGELVLAFCADLCLRLGNLEVVLKLPGGDF